MNNLLNSALKQVSRNLCVDYKLVESVYKSYWCFIKEGVTSVSIKEKCIEGLEFEENNINLPYLGKLYVSKGKVEKYKQQIKNYQNVKTKRN